MTAASGPLLVIDTATRQAVIAIGGPDGSLRERRSWIAGYRHGEELLARIETLLGDLGLAAPALGGIVVGTGPGAFTGLRVGIATAKGLAHALALPIVGISTAEALLATAGCRAVLLQPAGPSDMVLSRAGHAPRILPGGTDPDPGDGQSLVAIDLEDRVSEAAAAAGSAAHEGLAAALLVAGAGRLARGDADDLATLVPEYVTLPRGALAPGPDSAIELTGGGGRP